MNNQKIENLLNLALDASDREREILTFSLPIPRFFFLEIMQFLRLRKKKSKSSLRWMK